jgi:hypothetical protein
VFGINSGAAFAALISNSPFRNRECRTHPQCPVRVPFGIYGDSCLRRSPSLGTNIQEDAATIDLESILTVGRRASRRFRRKTILVGGLKSVIAPPKNLRARKNMSRTTVCSRLPSDSATATTWMLVHHHLFHHRRRAGFEVRVTAVYHLDRGCTFWERRCREAG